MHLRDIGDPNSITNKNSVTQCIESGMERRDFNVVS
jgi:hypothetical protein